MLRNILSVLIAVTVMMSFSCAGESDTENAGSNPTLSTDIVNNPKTLEDGEVVTTTTRALPEMSFERDKFDFGDIIQGEGREFSFKFTNTGAANLVITNAKGSCGCTVPDWPREPIAPGASSYIRVTYDSKGRKNKFNKTVTIEANTVPNESKLYISGNVVVPEG